MKRSLLMSFLLPPFLLNAQKDLTVEAGAIKTLTSTERTLTLRSLSLGDNSTIIIPQTMDGWTVTATDVTIGENVKIIGQGSNGFIGANGTSLSYIAQNCKVGINGANGASGQYGSSGKNISLTLKIRSIGTLRINVNGTAGGNGGNGGNGGKGGPASCTCDAGAGGRGGNGGPGGSGGRGGNVKIIYSKIGNVTISNSNFLIQNSGGPMGYGGFGGQGGQGGAGGGCTDPKAAVRPAGTPGSAGLSGSRGGMGINGTTTISVQ